MQLHLTLRMKSNQTVYDRHHVHNILHVYKPFHADNLIEIFYMYADLRKNTRYTVVKVSPGG